MIDMGTMSVFGSMGILNVGAGDTKLSFDRNNPADRIRAARIVTDMLRRGYALLVEVGEGDDKHFVRAAAFDENTCEYIIADFDPVTAQAVDAEEESGDDEPVETAAAEGTPSPAKGGKPKSRGGRRKNPLRVKAEATRGVSVARSAGG